MGIIGLFYGSDTGNTERIARMIQEQLGEDVVDIKDIYETKAEDFDAYDKIILGLSTWYDGQLQSDWDDFFETFKGVDFTGKTVAVFGCGDSVGYSEYYCDGVGIVAKQAEANGAKLIGKWPTKGYEHTESKADLGNGMFIGLCLDEDNQSDLTEGRVSAWVAQIKKEFGI
jgi:flavodoxin I